MDFFEVFENRRSCHHFLPGKEISDEDFKGIVDKVRFTPSGYNAQPWEFVLIRNSETKKQIREFAFKQEICETSSALVIVVGDTDMARYSEEITKDWLDKGLASEHKAELIKQAMHKKRGPDKAHDMALRNASLAAMNFMLVAEAQGFATCPMMGFSQVDMRKLIELPEDRIIVMMIALGFADKEKTPPRLMRKKTEDIVYSEKFGQKL